VWIRRRVLAALPVSMVALRAKASEISRDIVPSTYLPTLHEILGNVKAAGDDPSAGPLTQLSQFYAILGNERLAIETNRKVKLQQFSMKGAAAPSAPPRPAPSPVAPLDSSAIDALEHIVERAREHQIVIINEAHHLSRCRAFATEVLKALRPLGFDYFAAEAFSPEVAGWKFGEPIAVTFGFYTRDPVFAELIRTAGALGYTLVDYEMLPEQAPTEPKPPLETIAIREQAQAKNIVKNVLEQNPKAKILILCGYGHAADNPPAPDAPRFFAARLKELTGIDPLTISQTAGQPGLGDEDRSEQTKAALSRFHRSRPFILRSGGSYVLAGPSDRMMDLSLFHPNLADVNGRAGWLVADDSRRPVAITVPVSVQKREAILQALPIGEGKHSVPADQYMLPKDTPVGTLYLKPGRYRLQIESPTGVYPLGNRSVS